MTLKTRVLAEYVVRRGLSQNGFAIKTGISGPYMAQLLSGKRRPSGRVRQKLLRATGLKFDDLFVIVIPDGSEGIKATYDSSIFSVQEANK